MGAGNMEAMGKQKPHQLPASPSIKDGGTASSLVKRPRVPLKPTLILELKQFPP